MSTRIEIIMIAVLISVACSLCGSFLVLRKMSMMADSITHTILLGIVLAFLCTYDLHSPFLIIGASLMGLFTVWLTEIIQNTKLVSNDSAIGIVFPFLFSIAVILISKYTKNVHLDLDSVILGELVFAPFNRLIILGTDIGSKALYTSLLILIVNIFFINVFFKELKLSTFDPTLAKILGFYPVLIHYVLMGIVSITAVGAFESVGAILVIAFMIGPPNIAYLITDKLSHMIILGALFGTLSSIIGCLVAFKMDISIAGSISVVIGIIFIIVLIIKSRKINQ